MSKLSNLQLIERIFHRINSESEGLRQISSSELSRAADRLTVDAKDTIRCFSLAAEEVDRRNLRAIK